MWMHFFWVFGHPEVYVLVIPAFAFVSEIIPVFSRKAIFGYPVMVAATVGIGFISMSVWAHHMFTVGMSAAGNTFFVLSTMAIAVPTGIKIFNWLATMWGGQIHFRVPMLFCVTFLFQFLIAGLTGVMLAAAPFDWQLTASYFVVAHFHYVIVGAILFGIFAAFYYWFPKMSGRMYNEKLGKWHFWLFTIGFHLTFDFMHIPGIPGDASPDLYLRARPRLGHLESHRDHRCILSGRRRPDFCRQPAVVLLPRRHRRERSLGCVDARMVHQFATSRAVQSSPGFLRSEAGGRCGT